MNDKPVVTLDELRKLMAGGEGPAKPRRTVLAAEKVHEHAVSTLHQLRGLTRADKRRVLKRAEKLLDA